MERESSSKNLQSILESISSSDVVESRIQLLEELGKLNLSEKSDLTSLWDGVADFTCLDVTQCMLNRTILQVAIKYLKSDISDCLEQCLPLGIKATIWCGKHLKMTLMSTQESQEEEHSNLFFQLLLEMLSFSAASFSALARYPLLVDKAFMDLVENFTLEQLNFTKDLISEIKRIPIFGTEVLKAAQKVIDAIIKLCLVYSQVANWEFSDGNPVKDRSTMDCEFPNDVNYVTNIFKCAIERLCELGIIAANDGGSLVTVLNMSWKGVVTLLQCGKGVLALKINIANIILSLVSLVIEPLRCAAKAWSCSPKENISVTEARRTFVPVKFYLINAIKVCSLYPTQALLVYKEVVLCVLMISTFKISLSSEMFLHAANEVITELLEEISLDLVKSLLNNNDLKKEQRVDILASLFAFESYSATADRDAGDYCRLDSMSKIFSVSCETMNGERILLLGRVALFLNLLRFSLDLDDHMKLQISRKLSQFLDAIVDEDVYAFILGLQIPVLYAIGKTREIVWQPLFSYILHALKTFMIVVSSNPAWEQLEAFLLENLFHPHFLCWEIVMELWCFMFRSADTGLVNAGINNLYSLLKLLASSSSESDLVQGSALRKVGRSISMLLTYGAQSLISKVYDSIIAEDKSQLSSAMHIALLLEGFPLNLISDEKRRSVNQKVINDYCGFIESFKDMSKIDSSVFGFPVLVASASLQSLHIAADIDARTLKFLAALICNYRKSGDSIIKDQSCKLLSETLGIVSNMKHLYASDEMEEVILELEKLFISGPTATDTRLYQCKPSLARFMSGLAHMEMTESDDNIKSSAVWALYHMLLRERHWALIHLALIAFGYFAARTSCNELWRFVPQNAALSYNFESGKGLNEEGFMSELKMFLEKERALSSVTPSSDQLDMLVSEGIILKEMFRKTSNFEREIKGNECMEIDGEMQCKKKRKLPDRISKGVELLQNGLKDIGDVLFQWPQDHLDSTELHNKLLTHFSRLKEEVACLVGLTGGD